MTFGDPGASPRGRLRHVAPTTYLPAVVHIPEVRHWFQDVLDEAVPVDAAEVATLLVTELATNAVRHADTEFTVYVALDDDLLRVEVQDRNHALPEVKAPGLEDEGGRGMFLVDRLSTRWGAEREPDIGKRVWFELAVA